MSTLHSQNFFLPFFTLFFFIFYLLISFFLPFFLSSFLSSISSFIFYLFLFLFLFLQSFIYLIIYLYHNSSWLLLSSTLIPIFFSSAPSPLTAFRSNTPFLNTHSTLLLYLLIGVVGSIHSEEYSYFPSHHEQSLYAHFLFFKQRRSAQKLDIIGEYRK